MPRLLGKRWTRFHISATEAHPEGRLIELQAHPAIEGAFFADVSDEEARILSAADVKPPAERAKADLLKPNGWSLGETDDEAEAKAEAKKAATGGDKGGA